jgi:hypothetical protein
LNFHFVLSHSTSCCLFNSPKSILIFFIFLARNNKILFLFPWTPPIALFLSFHLWFRSTHPPHHHHHRELYCANVYLLIHSEIVVVVLCVLIGSEIECYNVLIDFHFIPSFVCIRLPCVIVLMCLVMLLLLFFPLFFVAVYLILNVNCWMNL